MLNHPAPGNVACPLGLTIVRQARRACASLTIVHTSLRTLKTLGIIHFRRFLPKVLPSGGVKPYTFAIKTASRPLPARFPDLLVNTVNRQKRP